MRANHYVIALCHPNHEMISRPLQPFGLVTWKKVAMHHRYVTDVSFTITKKVHETHKMTSEQREGCGQGPDGYKHPGIGVVGVLASTGVLADPAYT